MKKGSGRGQKSSATPWNRRDPGARGVLHFLQNFWFSQMGFEQKGLEGYSKIELISPIWYALRFRHAHVSLSHPRKEQTTHNPTSISFRNLVISPMRCWLCVLRATRSCLANPATIPCLANPATVPCLANPATLPCLANPATLPCLANLATLPCLANPWQLFSGYDKMRIVRCLDDRG